MRCRRAGWRLRDAGRVVPRLGIDPSPDCGVFGAVWVFGQHVGALLLRIFDLHVEIHLEAVHEVVPLATVGVGEVAEILDIVFVFIIEDVQEEVVFTQSFVDELADQDE